MFTASALGLLLASTGVPTPTSPLMALPGVGVAWAQGGMDVDILTPGFTELPLSVQPGEPFTVSAATAAGAQCVGTVAFRDHPSIELAAMAAPDGICSWDVTTPPTVRPSTGIVHIDIDRGGQTWALTGTLWVSVVGERR
jgi:hypothetical protein